MHPIEKHYRQHRVQLVSMANRAVGYNDGEDVVKDMFTVAVAQWPDAGVEHPLAWFRMLMEQAIIRKHRENRMRGMTNMSPSHIPQWAEIELAQAPSNAEDRVYFNEVVDMIEAKSSLKAKALSLFMIDGFKAREVAEYLGIAVNHVEVMVYQFRKEHENA